MAHVHFMWPYTKCETLFSSALLISHYIFYIIRISCMYLNEAYITVDTARWNISYIVSGANLYTLINRECTQWYQIHVHINAPHYRPLTWMYRVASTMLTDFRFGWCVVPYHYNNSKNTGDSYLRGYLLMRMHSCCHEPRYKMMYV